MTNQHPITPPPELVERLCKNVIAFSTAMPPLTTKEVAVWLIEEAYVAGANQELEACAIYIARSGKHYLLSDELICARRPKPPSLKEQAQTELDRLIALIPTEGAMAMAEPIRKALEALPND